MSGHPRPGSAALPASDLGWQEGAACKGQFELFFGPEGETVKAAERRVKKAGAVCAGCEIRAACLTFAVERPEKYGYWGGADEVERELMRRRWLRSGTVAA